MKLTESIMERIENGGIHESFHLDVLSDVSVKITDKQILLSGKQIVNGNEYQPISDRIRRYDNEDGYMILAITYLMMKEFADGDPK